MRVATKLAAAFTLLLLLLGATIVYQVQTTRRVVSNAFSLPRVFSRMELSTADQLDELDRMEDMATKLAVTGYYQYRDPLDEAYRAFDATLREGNLLPSAPAERPERGRLIDLWIPVAGQVVALEAATAARDSAASGRLETLVGSIDQLRLQSRRVAEASRGVIRSRLERSVAAASDAERVSVGIALAALLLSIIVAIWIVRSIAAPLRRLSQGTRRIAEGRFDYRLDTSRGDEFAQLARDFNRMTEQLAVLDRIKTDFLSGVSHDLKTPLASMQETSRILLDGVTGTLTPDQRRLIALSLESGQRLFGMITKILEISALDAGASSPVFQAHDLRELVRRALEMAAPTLLERRIDVTAELAAQPVIVECDADRMLRVVDNLIENAAKFSPPRSVVRVGVGQAYAVPPGTPVEGRRRLAPHAAGGIGLLVVQDQGPGVPNAEKDRIFERFYQADSGARTRNRGVGLGLAISRETVEAHQGAIWVEDADPAGSRFVVALPAARAAAHTTRRAIRR